jgi:hypothetical protein
MILRINTPADKEKVIGYICKLPDKKFIITVETKKEIRSISQNNLYWSWVACISEETGNSRQKVHQELGLMFLPHKVGKMGEEAVSTTTLTTGDFKVYLDSVNLWANEFLGCVLPDPKDLYWEEFYDAYKDRI